MSTLSRRMTAHLVPNVLPAGHTRADYDFDYADGEWGPIRVSRQTNPQIFLDLPALIWCRRHGWEREILPERDVFQDAESKAWGWRCSLCGRDRIRVGWPKARAEESLEVHRRAKHAGGEVYEIRNGLGKSARRAVNAARKEAAQALLDEFDLEQLRTALDYLERERPGSIALMRAMLARKFEAVADAAV